jgi:hypothetical protein
MSDKVSYRSPSYYEIALEDRNGWRDHRDAAYFTYRAEWDRRAEKLDPGDFPLHIDIDPTNACNLKCVMCPRTHYLKTGNANWAPGGRIGYMDLDLYRRVIDQAAEGGAASIKLNYLGEPLLHPHLIDMIAHAAGRGLEPMMNTNAVLLDRNVSQQLIDAGLKDIFFSVDSPYPEEYERIRVGARFDRVIDNIAGFIRVLERSGVKDVQTRVSMVLGSEPGREQTKRDYIQLFQGLGVAEIGFGLPSDMDVDYWARYGPIHGFACPDPYRRLFVFFDGLIGPCCGDWERGLIMGDARTDNLADVWRNDAYRRLRDAQAQGRYWDVAICRQCSVPWLSTQEAE